MSREPDCPACGESYQHGQECQQKPWAEFRDYLPLYCMPHSKCPDCEDEMTDDINDISHTSTLAKFEKAVREKVIEECAVVADGARLSAAEHHGIEASIGADIAARRIRAMKDSK